VSRFAGRTVLVTGSTGMAASAARAIVAEGGSVVVASRTPEHVGDLLSTLDDRAHGVTADLTAEADAERAVAETVVRFGRIDALYAVAGISGRRFGDGPLHEATLEGWRTVVDANVTSLFLTARAAVRAMLAQEPDASGQRGTILAMSSALARHPAPQHFATHGYAATKGAIEAFVRATAGFYAPHGIRVNAIAPSLVATPMSERAQSDPAILAYLREKQPLAAGPIDADDVTSVALHLLAGESRMITGQVIQVDAGWSVSEPQLPR
jgi:NAD(P)-dependent dehydrogenase (short-subunit alcohol dehydrogenase family)